MSAYGKVRSVNKPRGILPPRLYPVLGPNVSDSKAAILTVAVDFAAGDAIDERLSQILRNDFNEELEAGQTYPQEEILDEAGYAAYFQSHDVILGFHLSKEQSMELYSPSIIPEDNIPPETGISLPRNTFTNITFSHIKVPDDHDFVVELEPTAYAFAYYIKPNYPGRSSHLCNAGFIVPPSLRGQGLGQIAARSFCFYGPASGYRGSVFNLVYVNNEASVKLWERLGFWNVGRIPEAGRLRKADGSGEEFVDAWVVYGDFRIVGVRDFM
ncbi:unnamed protein product [Periconia digitata]|uniref:N-acetyltransferase domain-containing protein n=1 Tax=Periconia digitata TaxID=1303443 RepID=A0A9W4XI91_9PLEO|nr:unnamed protein product [Periconia digitata]